MRERHPFHGRSYHIDTPVTYTYLAGVSLFYWITGYIYSTGYPVYSEVSATPLWNAICAVLPNKTITYLTGMLLLTGGAFLLHRANYILVIIREKTYIVPLVYILLISTNPNFFPLKSTSIGVFCLILAMYRLFITYHNPMAVYQVFSSALFIGIGSLLWVHILWFMPLFILGLFHFKSLSIRTFLASLMGVSTVYWFLLGWCVLQGDFSAFTVPFAAFTKIKIFEITGPRVIDWVIIFYIGIFVLIASVNIITHVYEENIRTRRYLYFLITFFVAAFLLFFLYENSSDEYFCIACVPASILVTHLFIVKKGKKVSRLFHLSALFFIVLTFVRLWNSLLSTAI